MSYQIQCSKYTTTSSLPEFDFLSIKFANLSLVFKYCGLVRFVELVVYKSVEDAGFARVPVPNDAELLVDHGLRHVESVTSCLDYQD